MIRAIQINEALKERFLDMVHVEPNSGCWLWGGVIDRWGYGRFKLMGLPRLAHRVSWKIRTGNDPGGMLCHACNNPPCVNPDHLYDGSAISNALDMRDNGKHPRIRMTAERAAEIRSAARSNVTLQWKEIGMAFGVSGNHVGRIVKGEQWSSVRGRG